MIINKVFTVKVLLKKFKKLNITTIKKIFVLNNQNCQFQKYINFQKILMIFCIILLCCFSMVTSKQFSAEIATTHCQIITQIKQETKDLILNQCLQKICIHQNQQCTQEIYSTLTQCFSNCCWFHNPTGTIQQLNKCIYQDREKMQRIQPWIIVVIILSLLTATTIIVFGVTALVQSKLLMLLNTQKLVQQNMKKKQKNGNIVDNIPGSVKSISQGSLDYKTQFIQNNELSVSILDDCPWFKKSKRYDASIICVICMKRQTDCQTACCHFFHRKCLMNKLIQNGTVGCPECSGISLTPLENICPICKRYYMKVELPQTLKYQTILWVKSFKLCPQCQQQDLH